MAAERDHAARTATAPRSDLARSEFPEERFEQVEPGGSIFEWILLGGLLLAATVGWILAGRRIEAPWIMGDELTYSEYAKSFADSGEFLFRDHQPTRFLSIYPALIAPAWRADSVQTAYSVAKAINVVLMVSAAIPLYLWARRLVTSGFALLSVVFLLVMPSFVYTGNVMTESAFLPVFILATFATALALERPTLLRQAFLIAAVALAVLMRLQALVFLLIVPTAVLLNALLALRAAGRPIRPRPVLSLLRPYLAATVVVAGVLLAFVLYFATGEGLDAGLGAYKEIPHASYSVGEVLRWTLTHLGELSLSVGLLPVSAFVVLLVLAWQRAATFSAPQRAFLAVTAAAVPWLVLQVAAFASEHSRRIEERNMFFLAPLLFLALCLWLARGLPRPRRTTAVAVLVPVALLVSIPLESLFNVSVRNDTFGLVPFFRLNDLLSGGTHDVRNLLVLGALVAGLMFAALPRWLMGLAIPAALVGFLLLSAYSVSGGAKVQSHAKRYAYALGPDPNWVDDRIGPDGNAAFLFTPELGSDPDVVAQAEFWNRSVRGIYDFGAPAFVFPGDDVASDPATGVIATTDGRPLSSSPYAIVDAGRISLAGKLVAQSGPLGLFELDGPARLRSRSEGIQPDGWSGADASYSQYWNPGNSPGRVTVELSRAGVGEQVPPTVVRLAVRRLPLKRGAAIAEKNETIASGDVKTVTLPTPRPPFAAYVHVDSTFTPADYGSPDIRQLGVRVAFRFKQR